MYSYTAICTLLTFTHIFLDIYFYDNDNLTGRRTKKSWGMGLVKLGETEHKTELS